MDVTSASGWTTEQGITDQSADWKQVLESGAYPYATFPLAKLMFHMPGVEAGESACLATLLAATRSNEPDYSVSEPEPGLVRVEATDGRLPDLRVDDQDLSVRSDASSLEVRFADAPEVPAVLRSWAAGEKG